jgi:hypothetical protein
MITYGIPVRQIPGIRWQKKAREFTETFISRIRWYPVFDIFVLVLQCGLKLTEKGGHCRKALGSFEHFILCSFEHTLSYTL